MEWKRAFNGILFLAVTVVLMGFAVDSGFAHEVPVQVQQEESPVDLACTDSDIPCSLRCGPAVLRSYSANGVNFTDMGQRAEINLLAGKSLLYSASCQPGFVAVGGGYKIVEGGTTIDLSEITISGNVAENNPHTNWNGWKVWVYRDNSGAPDNCLSLEVHTTCVRAH